MKRLYCILAVALLAMVSQRAEAQRFSISTNLLDYACLGTMNVETSYPLSRYWSLTLGLKYNPFTFRKDEPGNEIQLRQRSVSIGARMWPWHIWSGWWFAARARYQEYNFGGVVSPQTEEGDRIGTGLYVGYTYMLSPHFNLEFGLGAWGGLDWYRTYSCQTCGVTLNEGSRTFILPDDLMISLAYVF